MKARALQDLVGAWATQVRAAQDPAPKRRLRLLPALPEASTAPTDDAPVTRTRAHRASDEEALPARPVRRGECEDAPRPCPWVGCRHHLYLSVTKGGDLQIHSPLEVWEMAETCSLDLAARDGMTMDEVRPFFHVTRERIRQIEEKALAKIERHERVFRGPLAAEARDLGLVPLPPRARGGGQGEAEPVGDAGNVTEDEEQDGEDADVDE